VESAARCVLVDALVLGVEEQAKFTVVEDADELEPLREAALSARLGRDPIRNEQDVTLKVTVAAGLRC
jgi:hypothetical protein